MARLDITKVRIPGLDFSPAPRKLIGTSGDLVYRVAIRGQPAVVRFRKNSSSCIAEKSAQERAATAGLAPEVLFADIDEAFVVSAYAEGEPVAPKALRSSDVHIQSIGTCIRQLHRVEFSDPAIDLIQVGYSYVTLAAASVRDAATAEWVKLERLLHGVPLVAPCFSHNDLVAENIIVGSSYQFIDWAFAEPNDPFFDLAVVAGHHGFDEPAQASLLAAYGVEVDSSNFKRLRQWIEIYSQLHWLWLVARGQLGAARVLRTDIKI